MMSLAEYDLIIKALAGRYSQQIAAFVRGIEVSVEAVRDADKEAVAVQRSSDVLYKINEDGYEYIMLVEFQARPDKEMPRRLLEYVAMHHRRHQRPVYPVVINLTGSDRRQDGRYAIDCLELTVVEFNYRQLNLQDMPGQDFLYKGPVELLPLAPLMKQEDPPEAVLETCARRFDEEVESDSDRDVLYVALAALSSLRFPKDLILKVLEVIKIENLPLFDGIREEWKAKYLGEGIVESIIETLEENTGQRPNWIKESLSAVNDKDLLKRILRRAVKSKTMEEFEIALKELMPN
ncbi:Rpn family recombination-promoting nuclease/putative transposase [Desulfotruncus alcoholivorax]|uniref:Rpn family recombination-promoting nuclease/putative transposase n=1 Tax=Desulfotruncus alcoholivorax TaxID=265477 RepID=UPI00283AAF50|nr:Rpn family recombination-promoting nuclease/putative transposase [Desulfotruncus alcoholivorax]